MAERDKAKKDSWLNHPMPVDKKTKMEVDREYNSEDMEVIRMGSIPEEMEDKWFIYYDETEMKLYFHRSWTGFCIYIVSFEEKNENVFVASTVEMNRDPSQYTCTDDEKDLESFLFVLNVFLLGKY